MRPALVGGGALDLFLFLAGSSLALRCYEAATWGFFNTALVKQEPIHPEPNCFPAFDWDEAGATYSKMARG